MLDTQKFVKWDKSIDEGALNVGGWSMDYFNYPKAIYESLAKKYTKLGYRVILLADKVSPNRDSLTFISFVLLKDETSEMPNER